MVGARPGLRVLKKVQASTSQFESGFLDAEDLVRRLQASGVNVGHLQKALDSAVVRVVDKPDGTSGQAAGGLSVFFPAQGDSSDEEVARYDRLDFSKQTGWGKFISLWLAATSAVTDSRFIEAPSGHGRAAPAHIA